MQIWISYMDWFVWTWIHYISHVIWIYLGFTSLIMSCDNMCCSYHYSLTPKFLDKRKKYLTSRTSLSSLWIATFFWQMNNQKEDISNLQWSLDTSCWISLSYNLPKGIINLKWSCFIWPYQVISFSFFSSIFSIQFINFLIIIIILGKAQDSRFAFH